MIAFNENLTFDISIKCIKSHNELNDNHNVHNFVHNTHKAKIGTNLIPS